MPDTPEPLSPTLDPSYLKIIPLQILILFHLFHLFDFFHPLPKIYPSLPKLKFILLQNLLQTSPLQNVDPLPKNVFLTDPVSKNLPIPTLILSPPLPYLKLSLP